MFWADEVAKSIKNSKTTVKVDDMVTPSGNPHVGTLRGAILHDVAAKAVGQAGSKSDYTFVCNDLDPMDDIPIYLDAKKYQKYLGLPMSNVPAPKGSKSFAKFYMDQLYEIMEKLGCKFREVYDSEEYKKGSFDKAIKIALNNADKVRKIYKEVAGSEKPDDWYPFQPICEKCGKIGTTRVFDWDGKVVTYVCDESMVEWAKGCGHTGKVSPFGGTGKLHWKVEWPAHWYTFGIDIEGEGKDHASAGGSRDVANHLCKEVFKIKPPYDIPYEHIIFGGKKMSKSKGIGISAEEAFANVAPEIIRFMLIRNPGRVIDMDFHGMTIPLLYDEFDRSHQAYLGNIDFPDLGRTFYFSQASQNFNNGYKIKFSTLANLLQIPKVNIQKWAEADKGKKLDAAEIAELKSREKYARTWLSEYAPEDFKFEIQTKPPKVKLSESQKKFIGTLNGLAGKETYDEKIRDAIEKSGIEPKDGFVALYLIFIGKDHGPKASLMLSSLDKETVKERLSYFC